jgi:tetratricopeptide (TPR) repeat protein
VPLLLVCTARPELYDRAPGWAGGTRNATTIALSPLTEEETARLLSALLARAVLPAELQRLLLHNAEGNPLYAEEFVRLLTDRKLLERRGHTLHLAEESELPVPQTLQALIAARLDTLSPEHKALLQDAAVVGQVFWSGALAAMGQVDEQPVNHALHALARKELVRPMRRSSVAGQAEYAFWHVLVRDVAYGQLPRTARADRHRRAAEWLQALSPDRAEDRAELLAHHWQAALEFARATGQETAALAARARVALREAGDRALELNVFATATRWYSAALELWPAGEPERPQVLFRLGQARFHAHAAGTDVLTEARDELLTAGEREWAAEAEAMLGTLAYWQGHGQQGSHHYHRAAALLAKAPPSRAKASVLGELASWLMVAGKADEAIRTGREALAIADDLGLDDMRALALNSLGSARLHSGDVGGLADLERAVAVAVKVNSPECVRAYINLASCLVDLGDLDRAFKLQANGRQAAERFGLAGLVRHLQGEQVFEHYWRGRWDAAIRAADEFIADSEATMSHYMDSACWLIRGRIRLARGDSGGALQDADQMLAAARGIGDPQVVYPALAFRASISVAAGDMDQAAAYASDLLTRLADQDAAPSGADWPVDLAVVLQTLGRGKELVEVGSGTALTPWLQAAMAIAREMFEQAADIYAAIGSLPDEAFARLRAAQHLVAGQRRIEASEQLERALVFYREVRASAYLREAQALLAASA